MNKLTVAQKRIALAAIIFVFLILTVCIEKRFNRKIEEISEEVLTATAIPQQTDENGQTNYIILENTTKTTTEEVIEDDATHLSPSESSNMNIKSSLNTKSTITQKTTESSSVKSSIGTTAAFYYDDGEEILISNNEYYIICSIVMAEAGNSYEGRVAVAQSIRNQMIREKKAGRAYDINSVRSAYQLYYTKEPNNNTQIAVNDVFHNHIVVTKEFITVWCSSSVRSNWHSQQIFVCSYGGNNFYKMRVDA